MTPAELNAAAIELFGERRYTRELTNRLGVNYSTVWRWLGGRCPIPGTVDAAVAAWLREKERGK